MSAFFTAFLLVSLVVLLLSIYLATPPDPPSSPSTRPEERIEQCVRALGAPDSNSNPSSSNGNSSNGNNPNNHTRLSCDPTDPSPAAAQRRLLSMGTAAISPLLHCLERLSPHPLSYSASQQRGIELVLTDFGPQVLTHIARFYQRPLRSTPALPALSRILNALGPLCLPPLANNQPLPIALTAVLLQSIPPDDLSQTLARCEPLLSDAGLLWTATALLPLRTLLSPTSATSPPPLLASGPASNPSAKMPTLPPIRPLLCPHLYPSPYTSTPT